MTERQVNEVFSKYNFELTYEIVKENLSPDSIVLLCEWLEKYQCNIKELFKLRMQYKHWLLYAHELPEDDSRHEDTISNKQYPKEGAPKEAYKLADMENDFGIIENHLPHIEFTGEYLMS